MIQDDLNTGIICWQLSFCTHCWW